MILNKKLRNGVLPALLSTILLVYIIDFDREVYFEPLNIVLILTYLIIMSVVFYKITNHKKQDADV